LNRALNRAHLIRAAAVLALGADPSLGCGKAPPAPGSRPAAAALPSIALARNDAERLTKIVISRPDDSEGSHPARVTITLERRGHGWALTTPIAGEASASAVDDAIRNLETLQLWKQLDSGTLYYDQYDLADDKALHVAAWAGERKVVDLTCGKGAQEGQLVRLPDRDGMFALVNWGPQGYSGFLFTRALRSWRETSIFRFNEADVAAIEIHNRSGLLRFERRGGAWTGTRAAPRGPEQPWTSFDPGKIANLVRSYATLSADNFADGIGRADAGLDDPERTGGVLRISLRDGTTPTLRVGKPARDTTRWAIKDSRWAAKDGGDGTIYALSPWTAGWALADARRFQ
jgi:Domain of unknown function (DUF4340)